MGKFASLICAAAATWLHVTGAEAACVSSGIAADAVQARRAVAPDQALQQARRAVPDAEILRASLCHAAADALVYTVMLLRRDGKLVRVTVDAPSGKVIAVH